MTDPSTQVIHLKSKPWLIAWKTQQKPIRHSLRTSLAVMRDASQVRQRGDFLWHMQQAISLICIANNMPLRERRVMIRAQLAPLIVSLSQHPDLDLSKHKIQVFLSVVLKKFYEFANIDHKHASIFGTVIWSIAKRMETLSCLQTPLTKGWTIV
jgi:hypothetical protein